MIRLLLVNDADFGLLTYLEHEPVRARIANTMLSSMMRSPNPSPASGERSTYKTCSLYSTTCRAATEAVSPPRRQNHIHCERRHTARPRRSHCYRLMHDASCSIPQCFSGAVRGPGRRYPRQHRRSWTPRGPDDSNSAHSRTRVPSPPLPSEDRPLSPGRPPAPKAGHRTPRHCRCSQPSARPA